MSRTRIGLCPQGDERWIAGVIYLQNLIRACGLLPEEERPEFHLVHDPKTRRTTVSELGKLVPSEHVYSHRKISPKSELWRAACRSLRKGRRPVSLESLAQKLELSALFPLQASLGPEFPVPWIGWIPDFQHRRLPHFFPEEELQRRDRKFQQLIRESSHLVVSSLDSHRDLRRWFQVEEKRVSVLRFPSMMDPRWLEEPAQETVQAYRLPEKYLMFPSQYWTHKNHETLLRAVAIVKKDGGREIAVVFTGFQKDYRRPGHYNRIEELIGKLGLEQQVRALGLLPRHRQIQLMRQAAAIIQPSYFEGWSLLVEDCRRLGKTIYLTDIPVHREQDPPDAVYFNPDSAEELAAHLKRDWDRLSPGPDRAKEEQASVQSRERGLQYARDFLNVMAQATSAHGAGAPRR